MKMVKQLIASLLVIGAIVAIKPIQANASVLGWNKDNTGWWYSYGSSNWATGWKLIDSNWYYFYSDGYMAHDTTIDGYYLSSSGAWVTPADPSKKLSSGITLGEAKKSIDGTIERLKSMGQTVEDNMDLINKQCADMGTTYSEISRLPELATEKPVQPIQQTKPVQQPAQQQQSKPAQPQQSQPVQQPQSGGSQKTAIEGYDPFTQFGTGTGTAGTHSAAGDSIAHQNGY